MGQYDSQKTNPQKQNNFKWPDNSKAAISLTFDDSRISQLDLGIPILDKYDVKATFYVVGDLFKQRSDDWKRAVKNGHEVGNHSLTHPCTGSYSFSHKNSLENFTLEKMKRELVEASEIIQRLIGVKPVSFAYPCGQKFVGRGKSLKSYVPLVAETFHTGRGFRDEMPNAPDFCDPAQLLGMEFDQMNVEQTMQLISKTIKLGGWLILCGHEVGESGYQTVHTSTLEELCKYASISENGIWIDTVENIGEYFRKQDPG